MASMMAVLERHAELDALFFAHQSALLDRDVPAARAALRSYRERLSAHIAEEETHLLPLYEARCPQPPGGQARMFLDEHGKMRDLVAGVAARVDSLPVPPTPRALLELLDHETVFKNYLDHHDRRERTFLYPALDAALPEEERARLLGLLGVAG